MDKQFSNNLKAIRDAFKKVLISASAKELRLINYWLISMAQDLDAHVDYRKKFAEKKPDTEQAAKEIRELERIMEATQRAEDKSRKYWE